MHIGHKVKQLRKQKSWTQAQLAEAAMISIRTVQRLESRGRASRETLLSIAGALDVDIQDLLPIQKEVIIKISRKSSSLDKMNSFLLHLESQLRNNARKFWIWSLVLAFPGIYFFLANVAYYYWGITFLSVPLQGIYNNPAYFYWFNQVSPFIFLGGLFISVLINVLLLIRGRFEIQPHGIHSRFIIFFWKPAWSLLLINLIILFGMVSYLVVENI